METIQDVIGKDLLMKADRAARKSKLNRSALIREALEQHLKRLRIEDHERREREGYARIPDTGDWAVWEAVAAWPEP